jgi:hypothetical protein
MELMNYFSPVHLQSAKVLAEDARALEELYLTDDIGSEYDRDIDERIAHDGYVTNSIVSSISFSDSIVNESYQDLVSSAARWTNHDNPEEKFTEDEEFTYNLLQGLEDINDGKFERRPTLQKYELLLVYSGNNIFDRGSDPYQSMATVQKIRNNLVHFEPGWHHSEKALDTPGNLPKSLDSNPFYEVDNRDPESYLSADTAEWCMRAVGSFVKKFHEEAGIENHALINGIDRVICTV